MEEAQWSTQRSPALLVIGLIMLVIGASTSLGLQSGLIEYLKIDKNAWEMTSLP